MSTEFVRHLDVDVGETSIHGKIRIHAKCEDALSLPDLIELNREIDQWVQENLTDSFGEMACEVEDKMEEIKQNNEGR